MATIFDKNRPLRLESFTRSKNDMVNTIEAVYSYDIPSVDQDRIVHLIEAEYPGLDSSIYDVKVSPVRISLTTKIPQK